MAGELVTEAEPIESRGGRDAEELAGAGWVGAVTPTPKRVTHDAAYDALAALGRGAAPTQAKVESYNTLTDFLEQQRQSATSRRADVEVVRVLMQAAVAGKELSARECQLANAALDRLAGEGEGG